MKKSISTYLFYGLSILLFSSFLLGSVYTSNPPRLPGNDYVKFTEDGGYAIRLTNKTGAPSVRGLLVEVSDTVDSAVQISAADSYDPIGPFLESGIADGEEAWVVVSGLAYVLLKDSTACTRGYWVKSSDTVGRADATNAFPPGGTIVALETHMREIGHAAESKTAGTDVLCKINLHFL